MYVYVQIGENLNLNFTCFNKVFCNKVRNHQSAEVLVIGESGCVFFAVRDGKSENLVFYVLF